MAARPRYPRLLRDLALRLQVPDVFYRAELTRTGDLSFEELYRDMKASPMTMAVDVARAIFHQIESPGKGNHDRSVEHRA